MSCGDPVQPVLSDRLRDIQRTILEPNCTSSSCHGKFGKSFLSLIEDSAFTTLMRPTEHETARARYPRRVVPGNPDSSFLFIKITGPRADEGLQMPERLTPLSADQIDAIRRWILNGAPND